MTLGGGCSATHVGTSEKGPWVKRVAYGDEPEDWGAAEGRNCHDCNVAPGQLHHDGCDVERCPGCGRQMLQCGGEPDPECEAQTGIKPCPWTHLAALPPAEPSGDDPIVKVAVEGRGRLRLHQHRAAQRHGRARPVDPVARGARERRTCIAATTLGVPYDPNRQRPAGTRREAKALAREHDAVYEEV